MFFDFNTKEEFEAGLFENIKEYGPTNICNIINSSLNEKGKKTLKSLYGPRKIGEIIFNILEKSNKYEIVDKSSKDKNIWKFKLADIQDNKFSETEIEEISPVVEVEQTVKTVNKDKESKVEDKKKSVEEKSKGENPFELPVDEPDSGTPKRKTNKSLKKEINDNLVQVNDSFCICKYPITQAIYEKIMEKNPSEFKDNPYKDDEQQNRPVEKVSYLEAIKFCNKLSELCGYDKCYDEEQSVLIPDVNGFRLPTEKEWIFTANGGKEKSDTKYSGTNNPLAIWCDISASKKTHQVGKSASVQVNGKDVYDMSGNIWEMCEPEINSNMIPCFGGSFEDAKNRIELGKSSNRKEITKNYRNNAIGFRICVNYLKR